MRGGGSPVHCSRQKLQLQIIHSFLKTLLYLLFNFFFYDSLIKNSKKTVHYKAKIYIDPL
jgi:hypothetical protein